VIQVGKQTFNAVIYIPKSEKELDFVHYYQAQAYISKPKPPQYDFQFDYAKYLQGKILNTSVISIMKFWKRKERSKLHRSFPRKDWKFCKELMKPECLQSQEFLKGIILADRTEMDAQTVQDFNKSGLVHFLAISGTHIVVIFGLFYFY
jgi:competence protein ComEC